jgi:hypothetical protein
MEVAFSKMKRKVSSAAHDHVMLWKLELVSSERSWSGYVLERRSLSAQ